MDGCQGSKESEEGEKENDKDPVKPCAAALAASGKTVKPIAHRCDKITCSACGRRRFGITYEGDRAGCQKKKEGTKE